MADEMTAKSTFNARGAFVCPATETVSTREMKVAADMVDVLVCL